MIKIFDIISDPLDYFNYPQSEKNISNVEVRIERYMDSINKLNDSTKIKLRLSAVDFIIANLEEDIEGFMLLCKGRLSYMLYLV